MTDHGMAAIGVTLGLASGAVVALVDVSADPMLAISDGRFAALMLLGGTMVTSAGAALVALVQGRKTRDSHDRQHAAATTNVGDQVVGLRNHIDNRFDSLDHRLNDHAYRITQLEEPTKGPQL